MYPQGLLNGRQRILKHSPQPSNMLPCDYQHRYLVMISLRLICQMTREYIMSVPHASETKPYDLMRKHPPARARWYLKQKTRRWISPIGV